MKQTHHVIWEGNRKPLVCTMCRIPLHEEDPDIVSFKGIVLCERCAEDVVRFIKGTGAMKGESK